jgi:hypothetical protein
MQTNVKFFKIVSRVGAGGEARKRLRVVGRTGLLLHLKMRRDGECDGDGNASGAFGNTAGAVAAVASNDTDDKSADASTSRKRARVSASPSADAAARRRRASVSHDEHDSAQQKSSSALDAAISADGDLPSTKAHHHAQANGVGSALDGHASSSTRDTLAPVKLAVRTRRTTLSNKPTHPRPVEILFDHA